MSDLTTAGALGQYRRDLLAEGVDHDLADDLVRDAARSIHRDGLRVSPVRCVRTLGKTCPAHNAEHWRDSAGPFRASDAATASERFNAAVAYRSLQQLLAALMDAAKKEGDR